MSARAVVVALVLAAASPARAGTEATEVREFRLQHRSVAEATQAIEPMLSEVGTLTVRPSSASLVVQDRPAVVRRIAAFLERFDIPPPPQRLVLQLLLATQEPPPEGEPAARLSPDLLRRVRRVFHHRFLRLVGRSTVEAGPGGEVVVALGGRYRVRLKLQFAGPRTMGLHPGAVPARRREFRIDPLVVERGGEGRPVELLRTTVGMSPGQRVVVGATPSEDAAEALVLVVESLAGEGR